MLQYKPAFDEGMCYGRLRRRQPAFRKRCYDFESRELKPYSEPVSASDLKEGVIYFFINFADDAMLLPTMEPVVFIGRNLDANDAGVVYFQDIDSYQQGVRYCSPAENKNENAMIYSGSENETGHVFEYEHALEELMRCALRRRTMRK